MQQLYSLTRCIVILIILPFLSFSSSAQQKKFTGFFIDVEGDTIKGSFPGYRQWNHNPDRVRFMPLQSLTQIILTPSMCREFHVDGYDTYTAFHGKRMTNPMIYYQSARGSESDTYDTITTFLRQFATSDAYKFYIFKDKNRFNLYYSTTDGVMAELLQKVYVTENHFIESKTYKKQLQSLFPDKTEEINHLIYTEEDLATFLRKGKKAMVAIKNKRNRNGGFYISAGVSSNSLKFIPIVSMDFTEKNYKSRQVPLVSFGYIVPFSRNFSRAFFLPQIKISSIKHTVQTSDYDGYPVYSTTFQSSPVISLGFHLGYKVINHPNLELSVAPGAGFRFLTKFKQIDHYKFSSTNSWSVVTKMGHLKPLIDLQAMVIIKKRYVIWSAYNFPTHVTIYTTAKDKFSSKQLGVGYKFN